METQSYYWILVIILLLALFWSKRKNSTLVIQEHFTDSEENHNQLSQLLGSLLDNQTIANQILIDNPKIKSITDLVHQNQEKKTLKLKPILRESQSQILLRYLLLRDIYFIERESTEIITFARNKEILSPKQLFKTDSIRNSQLNKFRRQYHLQKNKYLSHNWIIDKIQTYITQYGFNKVTKAFANLKEVFDNYWEGQKELSRRDFNQLEIGTVIYDPSTQKYYFKVKEEQWSSWSQENVKLIERIQLDNFGEWFQRKKAEGTGIPPVSSYLWIRSSSLMSLEQLYRKVNELSRGDYFKLTPYYDRMINLSSDLTLSLERSERIKLLKKWINSKVKTELEKKFILENIINDLNHQVIQIFDDLTVYLIFNQYDSMDELHLNPVNITLNAWWSTNNLNALLVRSTLLGQCSLPAFLSMTQVQESPPLFKYIFNRNLYHTFWEPIEVYINQLEEHLELTFRTSNVNRIAPVARFCLLNNPSLREYLAKYITCTKSKCSDDVRSLKEPERCGQLKLKYQELLSLRQKYKCLFQSKTSANPKPKKEEILSLKEGFESSDLKADNSEIEVNQMMGFGKVVLLSVVEYAIKLHQCQTDQIKIRDCQDLDLHIEVEDQPTDQNLGQVEVDRQSDLYSIYDQQLDQYHKILHNQEVKKLKPLNLLANQNYQDQKRKVNFLQDTADDFHSIVNELTQLPEKVKKGDSEDFDNQLEDNLDLKESTFDQYKERLERQLKGFHPNQAEGILNQTKKIGYQVWDILTKDGRMMTSGFFIFVIAMALYFIDITS